MADLPRIFAQSNVPYQRRIPQASPEDYGAGVFHSLGQLADAMREKQKPIDVARHSSEYDIEIEDLKNALQAEPDPNTWREKFMQGEREIRKNRIGLIPDRDTAKGFQIHADRRYGDNVRGVLEKQILASHGKQLGDIEMVGKTLSKQAGETDDPAVRASAINTYNALVNTAATPTMIAGRPTPAAITPKQAEERRERFATDILRDRAKFLQASDPYKLRDEYNNGVYKSMALDEQAAVLEGVRIGIENRAATSDRNTAKMREMILRGAHAEANFGKLSDIFLRGIMAGQEPYLTPQDGRALKAINDNPPTGEGTDNVLGIMQEYHSGASSPGRIQSYRQQLNNLALTLGAPNKAIDKALNELQTDERTMYGIEASRTNRAIQAAEAEYDAKKPVLPFNMPLFTNKEKQDKAKIRDAVRKGQDPSKIIEQKTKDTKATDSISERNKRVLEIQ